jgi:hypothetical protein
MDDLGSLDPHWIWLSIGLALAALMEMVVQRLLDLAGGSCADHQRPYLRARFGG